jgi:hypothetical protein
MPLGAPEYKGSGSQPRSTVLNPPRAQEYGWTDNEGCLRPRDWEEYCKYFREVKLPKKDAEVEHRAVVSRRYGLATIRELISSNGGK